MDDSPVQTALCLIGHTIGGNPTQFVVTRVLTSMQLDWQFLSFDVEPSQFAKAIAGIDALGFFGAMIAAPYRTEVASVLAHLYGEHEGAIDEINDLIFRGPDGKFVAVNLLATALEQALEAHKQTSNLVAEQLICVTDDENVSAVLKQFEGALPEKQFIFRGAQLVRWPIAENSAEPTASEETQMTDPTMQVDTLDTSPQSSNDRKQESESIAENGLADPQSFDTQAATLVVWDVSGKPSRKSSQIGTASLIAVKEATGRLPIGSVLIDLSCSYDAWLGRPDASMVHTINRVDLKLRRLALAIHRWTGHEPNIEIMREAIEEYLEI